MRPKYNVSENVILINDGGLYTIIDFHEGSHMYFYKIQNKIDKKLIIDNIPESSLESIDSKK